MGFDWLLMLMEEHLHSSTVTAALWVLVVLLSNQAILGRFKEGLTGGGWLDHTDSVLTNKIGTVLGEMGRLGLWGAPQCLYLFVVLVFQCLISPKLVFVSHAVLFHIF